MLDCLIQDNYQQLFKLILHELSEVKLSKAKACLQLLRRLTKEPLLNPLLQEKKFVLVYKDLIILLNEGEREKALEELRQYFSFNTVIYEYEILLDLWINLAASLEAVEEFIVGKQLKTEFLLQKGQQEAGKKEYEDLLEMGIQDENMEYLKEMLRR